MFKNYFKTASRSLIRYRSYATINISGLAIGIAVCLIIFIIIQFQTSFDNFHQKRERIYRVLTEYHHADSKNIFYGKGVPFPMPAGLKIAFPQIEKVAPFYADQNDHLLIPGNSGEPGKKFKEENGVFFTEPSFFQIFDFPLLAGSYTSLKDPDNVLLTKQTAEKYFGDWKAAMGRTIKWATPYSTTILKVTGILASIPFNTDFRLKLVIAYGTGFTGSYFAKSTDWDGTSGGFGCYVLLPPNSSAANFNTQLRAYAKKVKSANNKDSHIIQPLNKIHYDTQTGDFSNQTISNNMINILWLIAAFILVIACVNFINLSTAQAVNRAKEVGVRKVLGSSKGQLQLQFIAETFLIVLTSMLIALAVTWLVLPVVNKILELSLTISIINALSIFLFAGITCIAVTLLAGFYPSIVLAAFNPINALKSRISAKNGKGISLRKGLVVFQFIVGQSLIIGTLIIVKQMNFFSNRSLGFDKEAIINVPIPGDSAGNTRLDYLRQQLLNETGVKMVSFNSNTPIENNDDNWGMPYFDKAIKTVDFYSIIKSADNNYVPVYKLPLVAGRNIRASDTVKEILVNEMFLKNLHIFNPEAGLNKEIKFGPKIKGSIVGILKDFNTRSFRDSLAPVIISSLKTNYNQASVKIATKDVKPVMASIERIWNTTYPDFVFEYTFLDDKIAGFYKQESQLASLYKIFAAIAIFLSCLGLYGLASFMAVQRIKEVGIRKVLGATAPGIVYLFSKEFIILITIAFAIATPLAWYFMHRWLAGFAFRIELSWWIFPAGGIVSVIVALASVSFRAMRAAIANPVKSLRTE